MTYATLQDLIDEFGGREVIALSDRDGDGVADADVITRALEKADEEINGFLEGRYPVPLALPAPALIVDIACRLARHKMTGGGGANRTEDIREDYLDATKRLAQIRDGKLGIGLTPAASPVATDGAVLIDAGQRTFTDGGLRDYSDPDRYGGHR